MSRPHLGITMGDPAGVGAEIIAKALSEEKLYQHSRPLVIGEVGTFQKALALTKKNKLSLNIIREVKEAKGEYGTVDFLDLANFSAETLVYGKVQKSCGQAAIAYIQKAAQLAQRGEIEALVTAPIHKEAVHLAGLPYPGHTELLAALTKTTDYALMLIHDNFRIVHLSNHLSLQDAIQAVKKERILKVIHLGYAFLKKLKIANPTLAVAGLNPHAGEEGLFGSEELREIIPAIEQAKKEGINVTGPLPPDTIFSKARGGEYDLVIAMYHDQGHIAMKVSGFIYEHQKKKWSSIKGVNVTLGLPIIRTSVDHGVAFDQAGAGTASPESLLEALYLAIELTKP